MRVREFLLYNKNKIDNIMKGMIAESKKMIKRKDGSYSKHGLWDSIRENKGSGKKPTKEMLKQEKKIKEK
jgi:hypothetical protein